MASYRSRKKQARYRHFNPSAVIILSTVVLVLLLIGSIFAYSRTQDSSKLPDITQDENTLPEVKQTEPQSQNTRSKDPGSENSNLPSTQGVNVVIVDAGVYGENIEVRAFAQGVLQDGICTISFTQGTSVVAKEVSAHADASSTVCTNPTITRSEFPSTGQWKVKVSFKSAKYNGTSEEKSIEL